MLFALDWMKASWDRVISQVLGLAEGLSIASIASALTDGWPVLIGCLLVSLALCGSGFRYHKLVIGATCSVLLAVLGWHIGRGIDTQHITVPALYALFLAIAGYFVFYILYSLAVFSGGWFFFLAATAPFAARLLDHRLWIAALLAAAYSVIYARYTLVMSSVTGALVMGLLAWSLSPGLGAFIFCAGGAGGIFLQRRLKREYDAKRVREAQEQLEKYPYGPGLAYGWPEPESTEKS